MKAVEPNSGHEPAATDSEPDFDALESASTGLDKEQTKRLHAAVDALTALDFLQLAERMKDTARALPLSGTDTGELRRRLAMLKDEANRVAPPGLEQIRELAGLPYRK